MIDIVGEHYPEALLKFTGTQWDANYRAYCQAHELPAHPARMQPALSAFFIEFLTDRQDAVEIWIRLQAQTRLGPLLKISAADGSRSGSR